MAFNGIHINDILKNYTFKQTPSQEQRNIIEIEGIEFSALFVTAYPQSVSNCILNERSRKEALDKTLKTKFPIAGKIGSEQPEGFMRMEELTKVLQRHDGRRRHMHVIISVLHECMANEAYSAAYYCSKPIALVKAQFVKVLTDLHIGPSKYDAQSVENDIRFSNGSRLVFAQSMAFGDFHIIAPEEPKPFSHSVSYIGVDLAG
jgi:hypothetical protein